MSDSYLHGDRVATEDLLDRKAFATLLAEDILAAPSAGGFVFSLMGPYGAGKTSVLEFTRTAIADRATVVAFEPWMFSGAEELVSRFFQSLASALAGSDSPKLKALASTAREYGQKLRPAGKVAGALADLLTGGAAGDIIDALTAETDEDLTKSRNEMIKTLKESEKKLVVLIDDVDRLTSAEIREVIRLVKNVADFPNTVFVLAYDRWNVEHALEGSVRDGREYLEKIIQAPHDLPAVARSVVRKIAFDEMGTALERRSITLSKEEEERWWRLYRVGVEPYLRTLRLARQWINVAPMRVRSAGEDVSPADVLAIEALRIFEPDLINQLDLTELLSLEVSLVDSISETQAKARADKLKPALAAAQQPAVAQALLVTLFPQLSKYLTGEARNRDVRSDRRAGRLASEDAYSAYVTATARDRRQIFELLNVMDDAGRLAEKLTQVPDEDLPGVLNELRDYVGEVSAQASTTAAPAFAGLLERTTHLDGGAFGPSPSREIMWLIEDLLATQPDDASRKAFISSLAESSSFTARLWTISWFGQTSESNGSESGLQPHVLSVDETSQLNDKLSEDLRAADPQLLKGRHDFWKFLVILNQSGHKEKIRAILSDNSLLAWAIQRLVVQYITNQDGQRVVARREFGWDVLVDLLGEDEAKARIGHLDRARAELTEDEVEALELAVLCASGDAAALHRRGRAGL